MPQAPSPIMTSFLHVAMVSESVFIQHCRRSSLDSRRNNVKPRAAAWKQLALVVPADDVLRTPIRHVEALMITRSWIGSWMNKGQGRALILVQNGASPSPAACSPKICGWQDQFKQQFPGKMLLECRLFVSWFRQCRCCAASRKKSCCRV